MCQTMQWYDTTARRYNYSTQLTANTAFIDSGYAATLVVVDKRHIHFLGSVLPICSYRMEPNCNGMATADGIGMLSQISGECPGILHLNVVHSLPIQPFDVVGNLVERCAIIGIG